MTISITTLLTNILLATNPLTSWLKSVPECYIHPSITIEKSKCGDGLGCFVSERVAEDELLFKIPTRECLSILDAIEDDECGDQFEKVLNKAGDGGEIVGIAGYIAKEYLKFEHEGNQYEGRFGPYLQVLPFELGKNDQDHVLWWSQDEIDTLLKGSMAYKDAIGIREEVDFAVKVLGGIIRQPVKRMRRGFFGLPFGGNDEGVDDAIRGAFVTILTRSFHAEGDERETRLVPLLDMLQHTSETPNIRHTTEDGFVQMYSRKALDQNTELLNSYNTLEPWKFFTRFGFVPGKSSDEIRDLFKAKDQLFFDDSSLKVAEV